MSFTDAFNDVFKDASDKASLFAKFGQAATNKEAWNNLLEKQKQAEAQEEPIYQPQEAGYIVEQEDQLSSEKPKKTTYGVDENETPEQAFDNWDTDNEVKTALNLDPKTGKLDIAPKQASESMSPRAYIQTIVDSNPYLAPVYKDTEFQRGTENWKRKNREGAEAFAKNKNAENATELINRALAMRGEYSAPQKDTSTEEKIQDLLSEKQVYELPGVQENIPKETRDKAVADIDNQLTSLRAMNIGNNATYAGNLASDKAKWDQDTNELIQGLIDEGANFYGYDKSDFTEALMNAGILPEKTTDTPSSGSGGQGTDTGVESAGSKGSVGLSDKQSEEFYKWLEETDSGKAFQDYWERQGLELGRDKKGWSRMRTTKNADLWGNVYGYGDLSKYDVEDFQAPENWNTRLANSGLDTNAEDIVDQLMNYMFVTHALRRSDLSSSGNTEWSRFGSKGDQDELISYLWDNGFFSNMDEGLRNAYSEAGLNADDVAALFMASRLSNGDYGDLSLEDLASIMNTSLGNAGDVFELGFLGEDSPFYEDNSRSNRQTYNPQMLWTGYSNGQIRPYAYDDTGNNLDLIDWNILDTYYQILNEEAQKQGKKAGLRTRG